jgi:hypothetical protein
MRIMEWIQRENENEYAYEHKCFHQYIPLVFPSMPKGDIFGQLV